MAKAPAAPALDLEDEDEDLVFKRLQQVLANTDLNISALGGGMRDAMLELFRHRPKLWGQMTESEQRDIANFIERAVNLVVGEAVILIEAENRPYTMGRLDKFTAKDGKYSITLTSQGGPELASDLARLDGHTVLIISGESSGYTSAAPAKVDPDEPPLEFDEEPDDGDESPPDDDSDLAGDDD